MRFIKIDNKLFWELIRNFLEQNGYNKVPDSTGSDEDFVYIDTLRKEWIYCENGFSPFCSQDEMLNYQFKLVNEVKLSDLDKMRY